MHRGPPIAGKERYREALYQSAKQSSHIAALHIDLAAAQHSRNAMKLKAAHFCCMRASASSKVASLSMMGALTPKL